MISSGSPADASVDVTRGTVDIGTGSLSYLRAGQGFPLVMLHPLAMAADVWRPVLGRFRTDFDVVMVDLRGHGESVAENVPFTIDDLADDVAGLLDALSIPRAHLLGMSMGGCVALSLASIRPDLVERLALCDTTAWYGADAPEKWADRAEMAKTDDRSTLLPFQLDRWFTEDFRRTHPAVAREVADVFVRTSPRTHQLACLALGRFDVRDRLAQITAKALVVTGEFDYATPPAMGQALADGLPDAEFELAPLSQHLAMIESTYVQDTVLEFLLGERA